MNERRRQYEHLQRAAQLQFAMLMLRIAVQIERKISS